MQNTCTDRPCFSSFILVRNCECNNETSHSQKNEKKIKIKVLYIVYGLSVVFVWNRKILSQGSVKYNMMFPLWLAEVSQVVLELCILRCSGQASVLTERADAVFCLQGAGIEDVIVQQERWKPSTQQRPQDNALRQACFMACCKGRFSRTVFHSLGGLEPVSIVSQKNPDLLTGRLCFSVKTPTKSNCLIFVWKITAQWR